MATKRDSKTIPPLEVARYYLKSELGHIFPEQAESLYGEVDKFPEGRIWRLTEAISTFYRLNGVWWVIANRNFRWTRETVPVERIVLTGMGDNPLDKLIHSERINREPLKLKSYLLDYYTKFPNDPKGYNIKPAGKPIRWPQIMLAEIGGGLRIIDGSHRFIEMLQRDMREAEAYVARSSQAIDKLKPTGGRGMIWLLDKLAARSTEQPEAVKSVSKILAEDSMFKDEFAHLVDGGHE